ncbi:MAG: hypothetical protein HQ509_08985 [Candidatus Marinimicrobia bacterium]|nr:hypothetical protein [Candidatus Neomarinimicrobiota bacterium]
MLTIKFAALNYSLPTKNQYAYILEGFEEQWTYCENRRTVTYTNLPSRTFYFQGQRI